MFFWNSKKRVDEKIARLDAKLADSFNRVKQDTRTIYQWLNFFYEESNKKKALIRHQQGEIHELKKRLEALPRPLSREQIKAVVDSYYDYDALFERVKGLSEKMTHLEAARHRPAEPRRVVVRGPAGGAPSMQEKMLKKITRNSKDYIKGMVLSLIRKYGRISAMALREMIVDEQGLCSKSSFYRILEEIEKEENVAVVSSGREKVFVSELSKSARK